MSIMVAAKAFEIMTVDWDVMGVNEHGAAPKVHWHMAFITVGFPMSGYLTFRNEIERYACPTRAFPSEEIGTSRTTRPSDVS